jgi:hypothetical protein
MTIRIIYRRRTIPRLKTSLLFSPVELFQRQREESVNKKSPAALGRFHQLNLALPTGYATS